MDHWTYWNWASQAVHHIGRPILISEGRDALTVASDLNELLAGKIIYCDSLEWDGFWCNVLFSDNGIHQQFELRDIRELLNTDTRLSAYLQKKEELTKTKCFNLHRALDDAKLIQQSIVHALFPHGL